MLAVVLGRVPGAALAQPVNEQAAAVEAFQERLADYMKLHERATSGLAMQKTDDPAKITEREREIARAIQQARGPATPGDLFGKDIRGFIVHTVRRDWWQRSRRDRRALLAEVPKDLPVEVNVPYPPTLPLATFPPALLKTLPALPEGLEYRFYGRHLILRDVEANLIADILPDILPAA